MRSVEEILDRIQERMPVDFMGIEANDLIQYLPFDAAKQFLKESFPKDQWKQIPSDKESVLKQMLEYMPFAWEKANNGRGLSAMRSMNHYSVWIWILGDDLGDLTNYQYYGKDNLIKICEKYGWDHTQWDDGIREN